ncbi:CPSF A subunit region-domain-containing protein [Gongronella butleri]|nr:CPSF A subunit region-domain-containing protein [Gongronella butleri]
MSAYTIHKELFPPQTVEHVQRGHFTSPHAVNLIVAKDSLLQIYRFVEYVPRPPDNTTTAPDQEAYPPLIPLGNDATTSARLELVSQYKLNGSIASMGVIRTTSPRGKQGCDSLLLAFDDAKMSLLEWSPETNSIVTVSLHYYERDELRKEFLNKTEKPSVHVDPQQRCAVLNFYNDKLAVLPFRQSDHLEDDDDDASNTRKRPFLDSFVIDLPKVHRAIKRVIHVTFLTDYYEPILAILYQTKQTWTGQLQESKDTAGVVVVSLDLTEKLYPVIYKVDQLPYDAFELVALPKPVHGMMVLAPNCLLHLSQGSPGVGTAVNGYTKTITNYKNMKYDAATISLGLALDGARALYLGDRVCAVFMQNGDWVLVKFVQDGNKVVSLDLVHRTFGSVAQSSLDNKNTWVNKDVPVALVPTCVTAVNQHYFFLSSRVGNSLLIQWKHSHISRARAALSADDYTFRVHDQLLNTGPIVDMAVGAMDGEPATPAGLPDLDLVCCSGYGNNGALSVMRRHIKPVASFYSEQSDCQAIWSIKCRANAPPSATQSNDTVDVTEESDVTLDRAHDKLLVISKSNSTKVLRAGESLEEMEHTGFYTRGSSILVSTLLSRTRIVQVHEKGIYLLTPDGKKLQQVNIREARVMEASVHDPYVLVLLENKTIHAYQLDDNNQLTGLPVPSSINAPKHINTASLFSDTSGIFTTVQNRMEMAAQQKKQSKSRQQAPTLKRRASEELTSSNAKNSKDSHITDAFDDVDMDLYGDQDEDNGAAGTNGHDQGTVPMDDVDDDDLYGDDDDAGKVEAISNDASVTGVKVDADNVSVLGGFKEFSQIATLWCMLYTDDDTCGIYSLPDLKPHFFVPKLSLLPDLLVDDQHQQAAKAEPTWPTGKPPLGAIQIRELLLTNIGKERKDPYLVLRTSTNDIVIYQAFEYIPSKENDDDGDTAMQDEEAQHRLAMRFTRIHHNEVSRHRVDLDAVREAEWQAQMLRDREETDNMVVELFDDDRTTKKKKKKKSTPRPRRVRLLNAFADVAGYTGVFVAGPQPLWLLSSSKSFVRVHPMKTDQNIIAFSQFHNVSCQHGFITIDTNSRLRFCSLPDVNYDMDWLVHKVPLGHTAHKICFHPEMNVYVVLASRDEQVDVVHAAPPPAKPAPAVVPGTTPSTSSSTSTTADQPAESTPASDAQSPANSIDAANADSASQHQDDDAKSTTARDPGAFLPSIPHFSLLLISPVTWETVDRVDLELFEQGICLECFSLESQQTTSGRKSFITLGTGVLRGEDIAMRGSIIMYEIIEVVPEPDNPQTNHKFKFLHKENAKGSVSAMCEVSGHIAASVGSKVFVYSFEDNESLVGVAFIDVQIYVTTMQSIKNYILLGDIHRSIWFLGFQLEPAKLALLGKDYQSCEVAAVSYVINDKALYLMLSDASDNMIIYQYAPYHLQSISGQKLIRRGDFHMGSQVRAMTRLPQIIMANGTQSLQYGASQFTLCGSYTGSISTISPLPEKTFKRLHTLYGQLVNSIPHVAGLNPRAYRLIKDTKQRLASNRNRVVLDGGIISLFVSLPVDRQVELTRQIGSSVPRIMEDIVDTMNISIDHF